MITPLAGKVAQANEEQYGADLRLFLEHADGSMFNVGDLSGHNWLDEIEWGKTVDDPTCGVTIKLRREIGDLSLAPLMEESILNDVGGNYAKRIHFARDFYVECNIYAHGGTPDPGEWFPILSGRTEKISWGGKTSTITINAQDHLSLLNFMVLNGKGSLWGTEAGVSMESVAQAILTHYLEGAAPTIYFETASEFNVTKFEVEAGKTLLEVLNQLVGHIGRFVEWRWHASSSAFKLVVSTPERNSEVAEPVAVIGPEQYLDVRAASTDLKTVRNYFTIKFRERPSGNIITRELINETSIEELGGYPHGVQAIEFTEPESSAIDTIPEADEYLEYADADLSTPLVTQEVENLFWPWVELGDYIQWEPNFKTMDSAFTWAVVSFRHHWSRGQRRTVFGTNGQAKGGQKRYRRRETETAPSPADQVARRSVLRVKRIKKTDLYTDLEPVVGPDVWRIIVYEQTWAIGEVDRTDPTAADRVGQLSPGETWRAMAPKQGFEKIVYFEPITSGFIVGDGMEYAVGPISAQAIPEFVYIEDRPNNGIELRISDPDGLGGTLEVWTNPETVTSPVATEPVDAEITIPSTPHTVLSTDNAALNNIAIHPTDGKMVIFRYTNTNDVTTGLRSYYMQGHSTLITLLDKLKVDAVERENVLALAINDLKIAALAITNAKIALAAVDTSNVVNLAISDIKVATNAITEAKIVDTAVSTAKIALLGVTDTRIAANAVTTDKLVALAVTAAKIAVGAIIAEKIDALAVTSDKIAALSIIAGKIAAGAINVSTIIADGVITNNLIALGTLTGDRISANSIVGAHLQGLTITGDKISGNTITADKITVSDLSAINVLFTGKVRIVDGTSDNEISFYDSLGALTAYIDAFNSGGNKGLRLYDSVSQPLVEWWTAGAQQTRFFGLTQVWTKGAADMDSSLELRFNLGGGTDTFRAVRLSNDFDTDGNRLLCVET